MKKTTTLLVFLLVSISSCAQDFTILQKNNFSTVEDFNKMRPEILKLANYILNTPVFPKTENKDIATAYIFTWGEYEIDFFGISLDDKKSLKLIDGPDELYTIYLVCLSKIALTNPNTHRNMTGAEIYDITSKMLAEYCSEKKNKLKPSKALKKIIKKMKKTKKG